MRTVRYTSVPWPNAMTIDYDPMTVFLLRDLKIEIYPGDTLETVAKAVHKYWRYSMEDSIKVAALYFAMGERRASRKPGPWTLDELDPSPDRVYNPQPCTDPALKPQTWQRQRDKRKATAV